MMAGMDSLPIVVVDPDPETHRALAECGDPGLQLVECVSARRGFNTCCAMEPACLVTELSLPDQDGMWLAASIRGQAGAVASTPIVMISTRDDAATRVRALRGGVDLFLTKPIRAVEIVAQVRALAAMASRIRARSAISAAARGIVREAPPSSRGQTGTLAGSLERTSIATVLAVLELERRTGDLRITASARAPALVLHITSGALESGRLGDRPLVALDAVQAALATRSGRFEFSSGADRPAPPTAAPMSQLLLAAMDGVQREPPVSPRLGTYAQLGDGGAEGESPRERRPAAPADGSRAQAAAASRRATARSSSGAQASSPRSKSARPPARAQTERPPAPPKGERTPDPRRTTLTSPAAQPPRRTTLMSQPAVQPKRRLSEQLRAAIRVEPPPAARPAPPHEAEEMPATTTRPGDDEADDASAGSSPRPGGRAGRRP